jgi:hypothetical protein
MFVALFEARSANEKRKQADRKVCLQAPINVASAKKRHALWLDTLQSVLSRSSASMYRLNAASIVDPCPA